MKKSVIIIRDGIAGLSTGCYGQMNGYSTENLNCITFPGDCAHLGNARVYI